MPNIIQHKRSSTSGVVPVATGLSQGELAINIADGKLYTKNSSNSVINLGVTSISGTSITPSSGLFSNSVGIGTTSPIAKLDIYGSGSSSIPTVKIRSSGSSASLFFNGIYDENIGKIYTNGNNLDFAVGDSFNFNTPAGNCLNIDGSNGLVHIPNDLNLDGNLNLLSAIVLPYTSFLYTSSLNIGNGNISTCQINDGEINNEIGLMNGSDSLAIQYYGDGSSVTHYGYGGGTPSNPKMVVLTNGNVGIGTTSPTSKLQVGGLITANSGNFTNLLSVNGTGVSISGHTHTASNITNFNSSVSGLLPVGTANYLSKFGTGGSGLSNGLVFDNGTNVGIGTASPTSKLHVAGDILATGSFIAGSGSVSNPSFEFANDPDTGLFSPASNTIALATSGVERLRIANNGSVSMNGPLNVDSQNAGQINCMFINAGTALGGSLSTDTLNIYQISANNIPTTNITLSDSVNISSDGGSNINLYDNVGISSPGDFSLTYDSTANFTIGDTSAILTLNNSNVGIGTTTPSAKLDVTGNVNIDGNLTFDSFTESVVAIGNSSTSKTISLASGTVQTCTLTANCTFTMPTATAGKSFNLFLNSGSGNYTASFSGVRWADSASPTATITASKVDIYSFISDGSFWYGSFSQNYG
jgi:hypothetical protein